MDRGTSKTEPVSIAPPGDAELRRKLAIRVAHFCPSWLTANIDDIVQAAWLRLHNAQKRNERNRNPGPSLLSRVAYCATVDEIRRRKRRREVPVDDARDIPDSPAADPSRASESREIAGAIRDCVTRLTNGRKAAVTLYLHGHTAPETGRVLGWTLKKAENMIFRGMADLRRCLTAKGLEP